MQLFSFQWQPAELNGAGDWHSKAQVYKSHPGAACGATAWREAMATEGCKIATRVVELVPDGKGGRVAKVIGDEIR